MSLDFDVSKVVDRKNVCEVEGGKWAPATQSLVWLTMAVGWGEITTENAAEWWARAHAWELLHGSMWRGVDGSDCPVTYADVLAHVGLRTNVFPKESDAAFAKKLWRTSREAFIRAIS